MKDEKLIKTVVEKTSFASMREVKVQLPDEFGKKVFTDGSSQGNLYRQGKHEYRLFRRVRVCVYALACVSVCVSRLHA